MAKSKQILGRLPVSRGAYDAAAFYYKHNVVQWENCSYELTVDGPVVGVTPADGSKWRLWSGIPVVQETGDAEGKVMSQKAVTDALEAEAARSDKKTEEIEKVLYNQFGAASMSLNVGLIERGVSTDIIATWGYSYNGVSTTPDAVSVQSGGSVVSTDTGDKHVMETVKDTKTYKVSATKNGVTKTASATVAAYDPIYYGSGGASLDASGVTALTKKVASSPAGSYTASVSEGAYMWICVPQGMKVNGVSSSGFSVPMNGATSVVVARTLGNVTYLCYRTANPLKAGSMSFTVS